MARKPAHLEMKGGKGLRQRVWDRIRAFDGTSFELTEIIKGAECKATARDYVVGLAAAGYLRITQKAGRSGSHFTAMRWALARDNGIEAPRVRKDGTAVTMGLAQEQMWRTLRALKSDTNARELAAYASTPQIAVSEVAAKDYLKCLHQASYLRCVAEGKGLGKGGIQARYQLVSNTGPRPPMVQRTDALYDPNLDAVVWIKPVNEETAIYGK
jgi:hypothetical protein